MVSFTPTQKKVALIVGIVVSLFFLVIFSAYGWLQSSSGKQQLVRWIESAANNEDTKLAIGSLEGTVPSAMVLTDIWVSDSEGVWLKLDRVEYRWSPWSLLGGKFWVKELTVHTIDLLRKPNYPKTESEPGRALSCGHFCHHWIKRRFAIPLVGICFQRFWRRVRHFSHYRRTTRSHWWFPSRCGNRRFCAKDHKFKAQ